MEELGLHWDDFEWRNYDITYFRTTTIDPKAEDFDSWSPYSWTMCNPVLMIDPDGQFASPYYDKDGNFLGTDEEGFKGDIMITDAGNFEYNKQAGTLTKASLAQSSSTKKISQTKLSGKSASNIFTHILKEKGFDVSKLHNGMVSISNGSNSFNNEIHFISSPAGTLWKGTTAPYFEINGEYMVTFNLAYSDKIFNTVENVENMGVHEITSHGDNKTGDYAKTHYKAYEAQFNHPSWKGTTNYFKSYMVDNYLDYTFREKPNSHSTIFNRMKATYGHLKEFKDVWKNR
jgi:hypothetical protein